MIENEKQKGPSEKSVMASAKTTTTTSQDEDVQDLAVLKRIKRAAESDEKNSYIIMIYPSRASLALINIYYSSIIIDIDVDSIVILIGS